MHDDIRLVLCAIENIKVRKIASSRFNYVFQFIIMFAHTANRGDIEFFSRARRDKIPKRVLYRGLISVQRAHKYITDGNEFLSLFTVLSISFIKQARVSLHNLLAPLRPVSFSISHLSLSITTVVPRVYNRRPVPSSLPPLSLLTLHSPGCPHRRAFFLSVLNWRKFFRDSSTA